MLSVLTELVRSGWRGGHVREVVAEEEVMFRSTEQVWFFVLLNSSTRCVLFFFLVVDLGSLTCVSFCRLVVDFFPSKKSLRENLVVVFFIGCGCRTTQLSFKNTTKKSSRNLLASSSFLFFLIFIYKKTQCLIFFSFPTQIQHLLQKLKMPS